MPQRDSNPKSQQAQTYALDIATGIGYVNIHIAIQSHKR